MLRNKTQDLRTSISGSAKYNSSGSSKTKECLLDNYPRPPSGYREERQVSSRPKHSKSRLHPKIPPSGYKGDDGKSINARIISYQPKEQSGGIGISGSVRFAFAKTAAGVGIFDDHTNSDDETALEDGETDITDSVLRGNLWYDERLRTVTIQGNWDHGKFRLSKKLDPEEDPEELFSGGDTSVITGLDGYFLHASDASMSTLATGKTFHKKKRRKIRILSTRQYGVEIRFSSLGDGLLQANDKGINEIDGFRQDGAGQPISDSKKLNEAIITKEYDRKEVDTNAPVMRGCKIGPIQNPFPVMTTKVTKEPTLPETRDQIHSRQCNVPSKRLEACRQRRQEDDTLVATLAPMAVEKDFKRESVPKEESHADNQRILGVSVKDFQRDFMLLSHASSCKKGRRCQVNPSCTQLKSLWKHISVCKQQECEICEFPNYSKYKTIWNHFQNCKNARCDYCAPIREIFAPLKGVAMSESDLAEVIMLS